jgi:non-heme chloroperoxidase
MTKMRREGYITTSDGTRIHYTDTGEGEAIVFIPGWMSDGAIWEKQVQGLSNRYRVLTIDPRSQGLSDKPTFGHLPEQRADDYKEVVDQLELKRPLLVGWSMACGELLSYVERFGDQDLSGIVFVDGLLPPNKNPEVAPILAYFTQLLQENRQQMADEFVPYWFKTPQSEDYLAAVKTTTYAVPVNSAVTLMHNMLSMTDVSGAFAKLTRPALFAYHPLVQPGADFLKAELGDRIQLERFDESGHALFVDHPERFNSLVQSFAESIFKP